MLEKLASRGRRNADSVITHAHDQFSVRLVRILKLTGDLDPTLGFRWIGVLDRIRYGIRETKLHSSSIYLDGREILGDSDLHATTLGCLAKLRGCARF